MTERKFDFEKYTRLLENFIMEMQNKYTPDTIVIEDCLDGICKLIGIGKIAMKKTPVNSNDLMHGRLDTQLYNSKEEICDTPFHLEEFTETVVHIDFYFYRKKDIPEWDDFYKKRITTLKKTLFTYIGWFTLIDYITYLEYYDSRFKIHNYNYMVSYISHILKNGNIDDYGIAYFGIDRFGIINKQIGEEKATIAIFNFLKKLESICGENGCVSTVNRVTGIVFFKKDISSEILSFLHGTRIDFGNPDDKIYISANAGVNLELINFKTADEIIDLTSSAFIQAQNKNGTTIIFIDDAFRKQTIQNQFIESIFIDAIKKEEFLVYYQPKVDIHGYTLAGAEALVRWKHEDKMIFPDQFIPIIEANYSIKYLDLYMLSHVCEDIRKWIDEGKKVVQISINLSRCSVAMPNIVDTIVTIIDNYQIPHSLIQIELTESASDIASHDLKVLVNGLRDAGISTAVDDFGTGFSSLSLIQKLPWNVLKIDKSLLQGAQLKGSHEQLMFKSIIRLANGIGLQCIAEGVETREDISLLKACNCYMAQGYYFDKPLPKEEFHKKLQNLNSEVNDLNVF